MSSLRYLRRAKTLYRPFVLWLGSESKQTMILSQQNSITLIGSQFTPRWLSMANQDKDRMNESSRKSLIIEQEDDSITDKIPDKPMTAAEGISYTAIILAAFAVLGACIWAFISNYVWNPVEYTCFNITLEKIRQDPRVTVRVGESIKGYGSESMNRRQRRMIRNRAYKDSNGVEHVQIQFNIRGTVGVGVVHADMYKDDSRKWQYTYLYVDIPEQGKNSVQRLALVTPPV